MGFADTLLMYVEVQHQQALAALNSIRVAVESVASSTRNMNHMFMQLTQKQLQGHSKTLEFLNRQSMASELLEQSNAIAVRSLFGVKSGIDNVNRSFRRFDASMLSILFGGMFLQRVFGGMTKSIITTFLKTEDQTSGLAQATTRLHASWEFLKFSIMDALNTDFFIGIIDGVVKAINWFSHLPEGVRQSVFLVTASLALIGTALMTIAAMKLFWDGILVKLGFTKAISTINSGLATTEAHLTTIGGISLSGLIAALSGAAVAAGAIYAGLKLTDALVAQFSEPAGAPSVATIAPHPMENMEILTDAIMGGTQEFSNFRAGMDSTIQIVNNMDKETGKLSSRILTHDDIVKGVTQSGENWIEAQTRQINLSPELQSALDGTTEAIKRQAEAYRELASARRRVASEYYAGEDVNFYMTSSPVSD